MSCPTCDHTMHYVGGEVQKFHLCPRCGTLKVQVGQGEPMFYTPELVRRCQDFEASLTAQWSPTEEVMERMRKHGITEAIHKPEDRP